MTIPYATVADLEAYLGQRVAMPEDPERLLRRASELIVTATNNRSERTEPFYTYGCDFTDAQYNLALSNAVCAQVEFWIEIGEEFDILDQSKQTSIGSLSITPPPKLALRARRALRGVGVLTSAVPTRSSW